MYLGFLMLQIPNNTPSKNNIVIASNSVSATNEITPLAITATILLLAAITGAIFTETSLKGMLSLAFAIFAYIILPGYFILLNFKISSLERIIFGMPISITLVSLTLYSADLIGVRLSTTNTILTILFICSAALIAGKYANRINNC